MNIKSFNWKNYDWIVDSYRGGPGPNIFDTANVFVKADGLHLRINKINKMWRCSTVRAAKPLKYGMYRCVIQGRVDLLDPNVVVSMFNYGGVDYLNEIDIEFSHWGVKDDTYPLNYTVYPPIESDPWAVSLPMVQTSSTTTHRFTWTDKGVSFMAQQGSKGIDDLTNIIATAQTELSPNTPMSLMFDLWLLGGKPPQNNLPVEIVITDFSFTPL